MPVFKGINSTSPIYNGNAKIIKIFKGLDLVYQSLLPTSDLFITSLCKVTAGTTPTVVDEYTMVSSSTTAVEGTQYYRYNGDKFTAVSISTGVAVGNDVATRNANYDTATGDTMIDLLAYKSSLTQTPEKFIINNTAKYNGSYYDIGKITAKLNLSSVDTSLTKEVYLSNKNSLVENVLTSTSDNVGGFLNLEKITISSNNIGFVFGKKDDRSQTPAMNSGGAVLTFKGPDITKISRNCLPHHNSQGHPRYSLNVKQIIFDTTNLKYIGPMGLMYMSSTTAAIPEVIIPDTVGFVALQSESLNGMASINTNDTTLLPITINSGYKTTTPNAQGKYWANISGDNPTIDANTIGIDYYVRKAQTNLYIPETVKHISGYRTYSDAETSTYANKNLYYNCNVEEAYTYSETTEVGPLSGIDVENLIFGANVTIIPKNMFYRPTSLGPNLYFNQPNGVNIDIQKGCFSYKSATTKNIYTDNEIVKNYDWATNENITPTFYHLDGTAW